LVGTLRQAALRNITTHTVMIERIWPLDEATQAYLSETIFRDTWGQRLQPYLSPDDYTELAALCDSQRPNYALRRTDFHFLQTFTLVTGEV